MCSGAIEQSRLKKTVYGVKNENYGYIHNLKNIKIISQICENECKELVQSFFKKRR
jgi:tRNA(adenine34) deaminase